MSTRARTFPRSARSSAGRPEGVVLGLLGAGIALAWAGAAAAGTPSCTVSTAPVAFGGYQATSNSDASGYVDVSCTCTTGNDCTDVPYQLEIQAGASASIAPRRMIRAGGTETLDYDLYQDGGHATVWGTGLDALGRTYTVLLFDSSQRTFVYGRVPSGQHVPPGTYGETPTVSMTY